MTDKEKIKVIDAIVFKTYEALPLVNFDDKGAFYEGIINSIFAVIQIKDENEVEEE